LISEIAEKKQIPLKFLENILLELRKAGILERKKGKGGGYMLKTSPDQTTLAVVLRVIDGSISCSPVSFCIFTSLAKPATRMIAASRFCLPRSDPLSGAPRSEKIFYSAY